ncbi:MAG: hydroxyisourate hydrolase [Thermoanaerobaculia bacterium]
MSQVTTHVLDLASGRPAAGMTVVLERVGADGAPEPIATARTDDNGRVAALGPETLPVGTYRLRFDTGGHHGGNGFFPEVAIAFELADPEQHYHVPLLLAPWSYTTYRGS